MPSLPPKQNTSLVSSRPAVAPPHSQQNLERYIDGLYRRVAAIQGI